MPLEGICEVMLLDCLLGSQVHSLIIMMIETSRLLVIDEKCTTTFRND
jgi:hypothetical protein